MSKPHEHQWRTSNGREGVVLWCAYRKGTYRCKAQHVEGYAAEEAWLIERWKQAQAEQARKGDTA